MFIPRVAALLALLILSTAAPSAADTRIGEARRIENSVTGKTAAVEKRLSKGDEVFLDQRIISDANSSGQFGLLDGTGFAVGPGANVVLDKFVYNPGGTVSSFAVSVTKGAFRFATGNGASSAYAIRTPTSTIGVRGTLFDMYVSGGSTLVVQLSGGTRVCGKDKRSCVELSAPCEAARVDPSGTVSKAARLNASFLKAEPAARAVPFVLNQGGLVGKLRAAPNTQAKCAAGLGGSPGGPDAPGDGTQGGRGPAPDGPSDPARGNTD